MIYATVEKSAGEYRSVSLMGHAGFAKRGKDIVCAATSALMINAVNSLKAFTDLEFQLVQNPEEGLMDIRIEGPVSKEAELLLDSLVLGLTGISEEYKSYLKMKSREV